MEQPTMFLKGAAPLNGIHHHSFSSGSQRHVTYSCGICGYELNLSSCNRITSTIGSKYGKSIKKGVISFFNVDESRFTQVDEIRCVPYFSNNSWGLFRRSTKLLCRKCGNHIGKAYDGKALADPLVELAVSGAMAEPKPGLSLNIQPDRPVEKKTNGGFI